MKLTFLFIISLCSTMMLHAQINVSKTLNLSAGTLSSSLTIDEKNSIAYLTLNGAIDARDFKTMRDDMPVLAEINLTGAVIVAYSGTEGTEGAPNDYLAKEIPKYAFLNPVGSVSKTSLAQIKFQPDLLSISYAAFLGCTGLTSIEIPATVNEIKNGAFENCTNLKSIKCAAKVPPTLTGNVFSGVSKTGCTMFVPFGSVASYKASGQWQDFQNIIEMIAYWTFDDQTGTMLRDHSGNGLYGKLAGSTWLIDNRLTCLSFNGTSDCVLVPNSPVFNVGNDDFAIEIHFKTSVIPSGTLSSLISKHNESINYDKDIEIFIQGGTGVPVFRLSDGTGNYETATGTTNVCDGQFHKVLGKREGNQLKIFVDGNLENSVNTTINPDNENWYNIGKTSYGNYPGSGFFAGIINEILITKTPMVQNEIVRTLIITESRMTATADNFVEITNVGNFPVQLNDFTFGQIRPWSDPWNPEPNKSFRLPQRVLQPGESFVMATVYDFGPEQFAMGLDGYPERVTKPDMLKLADIQIHVAEPNGYYPADSIIGDYWLTFDSYSGRECWYLEQTLPDNSKVIVDQVGGVFDVNGRNNPDGYYDVAGVAGATGNSILVRKYAVKSGNIDFANARGVGPEDSEWIPIPADLGAWRDVFWTLGNHGDYNLDANTLQSGVINVDFANKTLTVPWGIRNNDDIMNFFVQKPGIAWKYFANRNSANQNLTTAQTGDQLKIWVCGNDVDVAVFNIVVQAPPSNANIVVPVSSFTTTTMNETYAAQLRWPRVTRNASGIDTITGIQYGLPFALRTDSLLKYLEKAPNANWEFVWVDGNVRPDLKEGDKLRITAQNGAKKEYYIKMQNYKPNHNAYLSAISCPDLPGAYKIANGWNGDIIPNFGSTVYNYYIKLPYDVVGIPAFTAKTADLNAKVEVQRATNLNGTAEQRTVTFTVTAEDNSTIKIYKVVLTKEKNPANLQPYIGEPFLSELVFWDQWANSFGEIANPGNQPLDLSNYMIAMQWNTNPAEVIQMRMGAGEWLDRYDKYVPGYKWVNESNWSVSPGILEKDLMVNPIVQPGDVFAFGGIWQDGQTKPAYLPNYVWPVPGQLDVQFNNYTGLASYSNPWGEAISMNGIPIRKWMNSNWYMFKILNDSVKLGLKPANDPNDFELIERFGMADGSNWVIGGVNSNMITNWMRKPDVYKGNPVAQGSFGTNKDDTEWTWTNQQYWQQRNAGWPLEILNIGNDIGQHFMNPPTHYKSTVTSVVYKVSEGYSLKESIKGAKSGVTASVFLGGILKANEGQTLTLKGATGVIAGDGLLSNSDTLVVLSADKANTTKYIIDVSTEGLSANSTLTSTVYSVVLNGSGSSVSGFGYETTIRNVLGNVVIPVGATLTIVNASNEPVSLQEINRFGETVDKMVSDRIYFEVVAENNINNTLYQLKPDFNPADVFVISSLYNVNQNALLIKFVPAGTSVAALTANLVSSPGANVKVIDKMGFERTSGSVVADDKLVVNSADGLNQKVYGIFTNEGSPLVVIAGGLASLFTTEELAVITKLTLTGTIDARDFKTMRDDMPLLAEIDLSGATIAEYTGTEGTWWIESKIITYPVNEIPGYAFQNEKSSKTSLTSFIFPKTATSIGYNAFNGAINLTSIIIPPTITEIYDVAFAGCSFSTVTIPSSVTRIGIIAFSGANYINVEPDNPNYCSVDGVLFNKDKTILMQFPYSKTGSYTILPPVTKIDDHAFEYCRELTSVDIPSSVKSISHFAFLACVSLTSITIPSSVTYLGDWAFSDCIGLTSVYCHTLVPIDLNNSKDVFLNVDKTTCTLYVPYGSKVAYQAANQWQDFVNIVEINMNTAIVKKTTSAPIVDGVADPIWASANTYNINNNYGTELPTLGVGGETTWKALWNNDGIFILITVTDDEWYPSYLGGGNPWDFDKTEIYFDVNYVLKDNLGAKDNRGHYQISPTPELAKIDGTPTTDGDGTVWSFKVDNSNYIQELFIPFSKLNDKDGIGVDKTATIGFDVTIVDRDSGDSGRKRAVWANVGAIDESWANLDDAGIITFEGSGVSNRDMVAYYPFTGNTNDESGNGHNGTPENITLTTDRLKIADQAYQFNGVNSSVSIGTGLQLINNSKGLTFSAWIYPEMLLNGYQHTILGERSSGDNYQFAIINKQLYFSYWSGGSEYQFTGNTINEKIWQFVTVTYDGSFVKFYINGQLDRSFPATGLIDNNPSTLFIGTFNETVTTDGWFYGIIDELKIYNRPLSSTEITQLYTNSNVYVNVVNVIPGSITTDNGTLPMAANILPVNAINQKLHWTVENSSGRASIRADGLLTAIINGTVTVRAKATDGSGVEGSAVVTITGQVNQPEDFDIIRNGKFDFVNNDGITAVYWNGWTDNSPAHKVIDGVSVHSPVESANVWNYQFNQENLTALPNIPYVFKFKAWAAADRKIYVVFEDIPGNNYNRYGSSSDPRSNGRSEWTFDLTTEPTWYMVDVTFDQILPNTVQKVAFMLGLFSTATVYIDNVSLVSVSDLPFFNKEPIANAGHIQNVVKGTLVTLDGSASSDPNGDAITYHWTAPAEIILNYSNTANPTFTAPDVEIITPLTFNLIVNDGVLDSKTDEVVVNVIPTYTESDSLALVALYNATNGAKWTNKTNWLNGPMSAWYGITVSSGRVTKIDLQNNNLTGLIPAELGQLTNLQLLFLHYNQLTGSIPAELGQLTNLQQMYLSWNRLSGSIPEELMQLTNLQKFDLSANQLTGSLSANLKQLTNLNLLDLWGNRLTGSVPAGLGQLTKLKYLALDHNQFNKLPSLSTLTNLTAFLCYNNHLTFSDLEPNINVSGFQYAPQDSIGENLTISKNAGESLIYKLITGGTQNQYQWYKNGVKLNNQTSATLEINMLKMSDAGNYYCMVTNSLVPNLTLTTRILTLVINPGLCSGIGLVGSFNQWGSTGADVPFVQDVNNPCEWSLIYNFNNAGEVKFRQNNNWNVSWGNSNFPNGIAISNGPNIPVVIGTYNITFNSNTGDYNFQTFNVSCNVSDSLALVSIYNATKGSNWSRKDNWLTGKVQTWYGVTVNPDGRVIELNLVRNNLQGYLPVETGNLTGLKKLLLGYQMFNITNGNSNNLSQQPLPQTLENLTNLQILSLDQLYMNNELPDIFGGMNALRELYIQNCNFSNQSFPGSIATCSNLEIMQIYYNGFYSLPDLTGLSKLSILNADGCYFSFEDIEPNLWISNFSYYSQRLLLGAPESLNPSTGETIVRTINVGGTNNIYQWYKDSQALTTQITNTLTLENVTSQDAGIYTLKVTNSMATQLTLGSQPVILYQNQLPIYHALEALFNSTGGVNWKNNTNWLSDQPITTWFGITVNSSNGLIYLSLFNNNLIGTLPREFGDLSYFYYIQISYNPGLTGEIPESIGQLTNLQNLYLYNNSLSGHIPSTIGQLAKLSYLYLYNNSLTGDLPVEIGNMSKLYNLNISGNQIENIPAEITNCINLRYFQFNNNRISALPNLAGMDYLYRVYAQNNKLEFDDVIPMVGQIDVLNYAPQDSIGEALIYNKGVGESFSYSLVTPGEQNQYQWYKDGMLLNGKTNPSLEFTTLTLNEKGKYYCLVTNPQAPNLTLASRKITLNVESGENIKMLALAKPSPLSNNRAYCSLSNNEYITVRFTNTGKSPVSNFKIGYQVDGIQVAEETFTGTINPGDSVNYTFAKGANLAAITYLRTINIKCYLVYNDDISIDNSITTSKRIFGDYNDLPNWTTYNSCDGMLSDISFALAEDKNGNIWSTDFYGASKFDGTNWVTFTKENGLGDNYNWAMINDKEGNIWFTGTKDSIITKYNGVSFIKYPQPGNFEECIYQDSKGNIWFGSYSGAGVAMYNGNNWTYYSTTTGNLGNSVLSIGEDINGNMYFATGNGVVVYDGNSWNALIYPGNSTYVSEIFLDSKGNTWLTTDSNVFKYNGTNWVQFSSSDGIIGLCEDITEDIYGNIWFGGGHEIVKYDGVSWTKFTKEDGLAVATFEIYSLHADKNGNIWIGSYRAGISKFGQLQNTCSRNFHTIWEGTSGVDHMNINIIDAKYDGLDLELGDEIGIFDGNLCVGMGKLTKTINQQNILAIKVSRNDGSGNGYISGKDVIYKIWDCSTGTEYEVSDVQCFNNQFSPINCLPFEAGATTYVKLSDISVICQKIGFRGGWNIFSVPNQPVRAAIDTIFQPLISNNSLVKIQDEGGNSLEDWGIFGGWTNGIGNINPAEGYKIKTSRIDSVEICGKPVKFPYPIPLNFGWNIIGYPQTTTFDGLDIVQQLINRGTLLKVQDEGGNSIEDWGIFGGWTNGISDFIPGEGYKIKVNAKDTLWIYESYPKSTTIEPELVATTHFIPAYKGNGTDHMNINVVNLAESGIIEGDEIGIFDGDICVGSAKISNSFVGSNNISIPVSASDEIAETNGFSERNSISVKLYRNGTEFQMTLQPISGSTTVFEKGETLFAQFGLETGLEGIEDSKTAKINCYPNPFSDEVTIEINLAADAHVQVEVLNQLGQRVKMISTKQMLHGGLHKLEWDGRNAGNGEVAPGIYHVRIEIDDLIIHRKIVLSK